LPILTGWWPSRVVWDERPGWNPATQQIEMVRGYAITEFPFFSFWLGDMHPHVMALPFGVLALALALNIVARSTATAFVAQSGHIDPRWHRSRQSVHDQQLGFADVSADLPGSAGVQDCNTARHGSCRRSIPQHAAHHPPDTALAQLPGECAAHHCGERSADRAISADIHLAGWRGARRSSISR
jgi:hypothetical protein